MSVYPFIYVCFICTSSSQATIVSPFKWNTRDILIATIKLVACARTYIYNCVFHLGSAIVAATKIDRARPALPRKGGFSRCDYRTAQMKPTVTYGSERTGDYLIMAIKKSQLVPF